MGGGKCPSPSCSATFASGKAKRRHVFRESHGHYVQCSICNEPFLSEVALKRHMGSIDHSRVKVSRRRRKRGKSSKGGSLGKGTAVNENSDIDVTVVLGGIDDIQTPKSRLPEILSKPKTHLHSLHGARVTGTTKHAVQVDLDGHSVDTLPAMDIDIFNGITIGGGVCPSPSCSATFASGKAKRRHVFREGHGHYVQCSICNEPFLSERARQQHMDSIDHSRVKVSRPRRRRGKCSKVIHN